MPNKLLAQSAVVSKSTAASLVNLLRFLLKLSPRANRHTAFLTVSSLIIAIITAYRHFVSDHARSRRRRRRLPPGPINFPFVGILPHLAGTDDPGKAVLELSMKYGSVFYGRLGNFDAIFLNDYESVKEAFAKSGDAFSDRPRITAFETYGQGKGIACCYYDNHWKEQRRFVLRLLRNMGMGRTGNGLENLLHNEAAIMVKTFSETRGESFNPQILLTMVVSNIICGLTFDKRFDYDNKEFEKFIMTLESIFHGADVAGATNYFTFMKYIPFSAFKRMGAYARSLERGLFTREKDAHKITYDADKCKDMIDFFLKEVREQESKQGSGDAPVTGFKEENLPALIGDIFAAGTDTTACSLNWLLIYSMKYPKFQRRVQDELDKVVGRNRLPRLSDRANLPFVTAMLTESMRVSSAGPLGVPHAAIADTSFRGFDVAKGTIMIANHYAILYDPEVFVEPEVFNPCRYLDEDGMLIKSLIDRTCSQFGIGRRACPGEQLAQSERFIFYTHLVHQFNIRAPNGPDSVNLGSHFGLSRSPLPYNVQAEARKLDLRPQESEAIPA